VKLSLCLTKHYAMKIYWGVKVKQNYTFLTLDYAKDLILTLMPQTLRKDELQY